MRMANFDFIGLDEIEKDFANVARLPVAVMDEMLSAQADVIVPAQEEKARTMLQGPYNRGVVATSIKRKRPTPAPDGRKMFLTFDGTQHGNRVAEIAFVNEYGTSSQAARPFIKTALDEKGDVAVEAAAAVHDKWLTKNGL